MSNFDLYLRANSSKFASVSSISLGGGWGWYWTGSILIEFCNEFDSWSNLDRLVPAGLISRLWYWYVDCRSFLVGWDFLASVNNRFKIAISRFFFSNWSVNALFFSLNVELDSFNFAIWSLNSFWSIRRSSTSFVRNVTVNG